MEDDERFKIPQPQGVGEKDVLQEIEDIKRRLRRLESQAGTS